MELLLFIDTQLGSGDSDLCLFFLLILTLDKYNAILDQPVVNLLFLNLSSQALAAVYNRSIIPLIDIYSFSRCFYSNLEMRNTTK